MDPCGVGVIQIPRRKRAETMVEGDIRCQLGVEQVQIKKEEIQQEARTERNLENRAYYDMSHHGGSKSFARLRREMAAPLIIHFMYTKDGKELDKLEFFEATYKPQRPENKLGDALAVALDEIRTKLDGLPKSSKSAKAVRDKIYEEIIGEDKNGYAKTYELGVKVSHSHEKRCALANEREKRIKAEDLKHMTLKLQETEEKVERAQHKVERVVDWVGRVMGDLLLLTVMPENLFPTLLKHFNVEIFILW
ncbi:hypothetical protein Cgig2_010198 [Carnegiea gigantea]|uniref:Uncharacterized protein n=1 Tax=Carnegiea gigantea TaxID=171969 RepID=A0A9Q1GWN2_9CARY|nr:hypothetical protein Cgig2_010198 [Carnegiea gigantea]